MVAGSAVGAMNLLRVTPLDAVIVAGYFLFVLGLGLWFGRR